VLFFPQNYSAIARVDPGRGVEKVRRDVTLDPGWTFKGTVLGPDGKPLAGARRFDLNGRRWWDPEPLKTPEFTAGFSPRHPHDVLLQHRERGLVGVARPPKENGGSVTVRMEPGAAVTGRLVDAGGRPQAGVELDLALRPKGWGGWHDYSPERIKTDRQGRFRIAALLPGYEFRLTGDRGSLPLGSGLRSGQTRDLGDVQLKPDKE
jgi:hypothetical protein